MNSPPLASVRIVPFGAQSQANLITNSQVIMKYNRVASGLTQLKARERERVRQTNCFLARFWQQLTQRLTTCETKKACIDPASRDEEKKKKKKKERKSSSRIRAVGTTALMQ